jgi:hypothetical protein
MKVALHCVKALVFQSSCPKPTTLVFGFPVQLTTAADSSSGHAPAIANIRPSLDRIDWSLRLTDMWGQNIVRAA